MSDRLLTLAAVLLLAAAGALSWWLQFREPLHANVTSLAALPQKLGNFSGTDTPVADNVVEMLDADYHLQRAYMHPFGDVVWLYIGYYGTERGGTPEHTPRACYLAHGWRIEDGTSVVIDAERGLKAVEYLVNDRGRRQLVLFWYRSFRRSGITSTMELRMDHLVGQIAAGRADGALVRLSTGLDDPTSRATTRALLVSFARKLERELGGVWPEETGRQKGEDRAASVVRSAELPARVTRAAR